MSQTELLTTEDGGTTLPSLPPSVLLKAELSGQPSGANLESAISATVSGSSITHYKFKLGNVDATDCSVSDGYSEARAVSDKATADLSSITDGSTVILCVVGGDTSTNQWQDYASATSVKWYKGSISVQISDDEETFQESNVNKSFTISLSHVNTVDTVVKYVVFGSSSPGVDHSLSSGTATIAAGSLSKTIQFEYYDNSSFTSEKDIKLSLDSATQGAQVGAKALAKKIIKDDDQTALTVQSIMATSGGINAYGCALLTGGILKCWGTAWASFMQWSSVAEPYSSSIYTKVAGHYSHICGISDTAELKCWGANAFGQLGLGDYSTRSNPTAVDSGTSYAQVDLGSVHTCAITTAGALKCWGSGSDGRLGTGSSLTWTTPQLIDSGVNYSVISGGQDHTCGITTTGVLKCWGDNSLAQLGNGTTTDQYSPVVIDSGVSYSSVSAGKVHTCGITTTGVLKCWGYNGLGQLGDSAANDSGQDYASLPHVIDSGVTYSAVSAGAASTCAITTLGVLKCWGENTSGQIGNGLKTWTDQGTSASQWTPLIVDSGTTYSSVSVGQDFSCGVTTSGRGKCWGSNYYNQMGDLVDYLVLSPKSSGFQLSSVAMSRSAYHSCGLVTDGYLKCWGENLEGQLGTGQRSTAESVPMMVDSTVKYSQVSLGEKFGCGLTKAGAIKCWGKNDQGQLGIGTTTSSYGPTLVDSGTVYAQVSSGKTHSCAVTTNGVLKCWGYNNNGQLGDGGTTRSLSPEVIDTGVTYASVSGGDNHTCGLTTDGVLKCWGLNSLGQLGDGTTTKRLIPTVIDLGVSYSVIVAGGTHTCGITTIGVLKCWGYNLYGKLGDGTQTQRLSPVVIDSGVSYKQVTIDTYSSCGLTTDGSVKCWGLNTSGQLGSGDQVNQLSPILIDSSTKYQSIASGVNGTCGVSTDGTLKCWGANLHGRFADGQTTEFLTPHEVFRLHDN